MDNSNRAPVVGEYMLPIIDERTKISDPWQRNYNQPPPMERLIPSQYPLVDIRPLTAEIDYSPSRLLQSHGFGLVKHHSTFLEQLDGSLGREKLTELYFPEIKQLVRETSGARSVFIVGSVLRQGKVAPEAYKMPTKLGSVKDAITISNDKIGSQQKENQPQPHKLAGQTNLNLAAPIRIPHLDFTPLGARQAIRLQSSEILAAAAEGGIIAYEDEICNKSQVKAVEKEADAVIAQSYNIWGQLGPRYAAYSIWRPLKQVQRDPITLASRREEPQTQDGLVYWPYLNKIKGNPDLSSDYLREYAMLGARREQALVDDQTKEQLKWYYVSHREPDEVLFIKLFDSASLGSTAQHAGAPWHASPEIGAAEGVEPRESIDIRVIAIW